MNSVVCHVISHVLTTVSDVHGLVDRFMFRVYGLSEYLLKYVVLFYSVTFWIFCFQMFVEYSCLCGVDENSYLFVINFRTQGTHAPKG